MFWDHLNIFIEALYMVEETEMELRADVGHRLHLDFNHMLLLGHANYPVAKAMAAGSIPPEMKAVWHRLEQAGVKTDFRPKCNGRKRKRGTRSVSAERNVARRHEMQDPRNNNTTHE